MVHDIGAWNRPWRLVKGIVGSYISVTNGHQIRGIDLLSPDNETVNCPISYSQTSRNSLFSDEVMYGPALNLLLFGENDDDGCSIADDLLELSQGLVCMDWLSMYGEHLVSLPEICLRIFIVSTPAKVCKNNHIVKFLIWDSVSCFWLHL